MFVDNDFIYLFSVNTFPERPGKQCLIISRSPVSEGGLPHTWKNYYNGGFKEDALPRGFIKESMHNFYSVGGGKADCIFDLTDPTAKERNHIYFNVAKVRNTPYYLGVVEETKSAETSAPGEWYLRFVISSDLIHWYPVQTCTITQGCYNHIFHWKVVAPSPQKEGWDYAVLSYPTLYNTEGMVNDTIDADEFYLVGTNIADNYNLYKLKLSLNLPTNVTPPTNTATPTPNNTATTTLIPTNSPAFCSKKPQGDTNCDGNINEMDYNLWKCEFLGSGTCKITFSQKTANFNSDDKVDLIDFEIWRRNFFYFNTNSRP